MKNEDLVFLGKAGKVCGPFTATKLKRMELSGELREYSWIWENGWRPLDAAPQAAPDLDAYRPKMTSKAVRAICFDGRESVSGVLSQVSKVGCHFTVSSQSRLALKKRDSRLMLSLLEELSLQVAQVEIVFLGAEKEAEGWRCFFGWGAVPEVLHV